MEKYDVVVIGDDPAGASCAAFAHTTYPDKKIVVVRKEPIALIPDGIPYTLQSLNTIEEDILQDSFVKDNGADLIIDEVVKKEGTTLELKSSRKLSYDKLVLAVGSIPVRPPIKGIDKKGVFLVRNNYEYLAQMRKFAEKCQDIVVIMDGGYIGLEIADEALRARKTVTIIGMKDHFLSLYMDSEFGDKVKEILEARGAQVLLGNKIQSIAGGKTEWGIRLVSGEFLPAQMVIVSTGSRPDLELAKKFDLAYDPIHGILVDEYQRTSDKDVFAIGDCLAKKDFFTGEFTDVRLASTAMAEGRLVGADLFKIKVIRKFIDVLGSFSFKIDNTAFGICGITEAKVKSMKLDYTVGEATTVYRYLDKFTGASKIHLKFIFARHSHFLLGAQIYGGDSVGEMVNMFSVMILNKMTDREIDNLQICTHPLLTASPFAYPVFTATMDAINKWSQ